MKQKTGKNCVFSLVLAFFIALFINLKAIPVSAASSFTLSPMNQTVQLTPGTDYSGSFKINNPAGNSDFEYRLEITPFWVDDSYNVIYESHENYNQITNWISYQEATGTVPAGSSKTVNFTIKTPVSATPGGQYVIIRVSSRDGSTTETASGTRGAYSLAHVIYAEVVGEGISRSASVSEVQLPHFVLSGIISSSAKIVNTGNTLGVVKVTMEAYPLFSNELKYSNFDSPATYKILPGASRIVVLSWDNSPKLGIFKVLNKVYYNEELLETTDSFVLLIPLWLLIIIIILIIAIVALIVYLKLNKRNKNAQTPIAPQSIVEE